MELAELFERTGRKTSIRPPRTDEGKPDKPDGTPFIRQPYGLPTSQFEVLATHVLTQITDRGAVADYIPWLLIEAMGWDPIIYLGEFLFAAPLRDPDLYQVQHPDPEIKAETEAWLRPILPSVLNAVSRSFSRGVSPWVCNWVESDLTVKVPTEDGKPKFRVIENHVHFGKVSELAAGNTRLLLDKETRTEVEGLVYGTDVYPEQRSFLSVFDKTGGSWTGNGSRRRAYKAWYKGEFLDLWQGQWLERGVDPPRIGYAPKGTVTIDGEEIMAVEVLRDAIMSLKNGSAAVLPGTMDEETKTRLWEIMALELPDVSDVWHKALDRTDAQKLLSALVPPTVAGLEDGTFAGGRVVAGLYLETLSAVGRFVAQEVNKPLEKVHRLRHGNTSPAPTMKAGELNQQKVNRSMEVFKAISDVERRAGKDKVVTLAELVDAEALLRDMKVEARPTEEAAREKEAPIDLGNATPGPDKDGMSDRGERRENAREPEGENATGEEGQEVKD